MQETTPHNNALSSLTFDQRESILLDLAKLPDAELSMLGGSPGGESIYVIENGAELNAASEIDCLLSHAYSCGLEIAEPTQAEEDAEYPGSWVVRMRSNGMDAGVLCNAKTLEDARIMRIGALRDISGTVVQNLYEWARKRQEASYRALMADLQTGESESHSQDAKKKEHKKPFVSVRNEVLHSLPIAPSVQMARTPREPFQVRRKQMEHYLDTPSGLSSMQGQGLQMNIQCVSDGDKLYANHHDVLSSVRLGLDAMHISPWPEHLAHTYLIKQELRQTMRQRGYVELLDFDPATVFTMDRPTIAIEAAQVLTEEGETDPPAKPKRKGHPSKIRPMSLKELRTLKPEFPPAERNGQKVVIVLDRARLAMATEPEWEQVLTRDVHEFCGGLWVEIDIPKKTRNARK